MSTPLGPRPRLLVLASTYPRWLDDDLPPFVHELARRLVPQYEVHVLAPHTAGASTQEDLDGVQVHRFRYLPARFETLAYSGGMLPGLRRRPWRLLALPLFLMTEWLAALRLLRQHRFAAIHAHWLLPHGLLALMARALCGYCPRLICTSHGADLYGLKGGLARSLQRLVLRGSDHVTVVSRAMLETLRARFDDTSHCSVLSMGVDTQMLFTPPPAGSPRSGLLFVGRLAEKKGVDVLLDALAQLPEPITPRLTVIGTGSEWSTLQAQVQQLGLARRVEFLGGLPNRELPAWYRRSLIAVFPSRVARDGDQEGLGLVPVEALACSCAVVASDLPAVRDVIRDGETGIIVKPDDASALAQALHGLLQDPARRDRLADAGRRDVSARFDWEGITNSYRRLYTHSPDGTSDLTPRQ